MPKTLLGKWSVGLIILFFLLFIVLQLLVASGQQGPGFNPWLASAVIPAGIAGIAAFFTGIIAIIKAKERSPLVFLATFIGLVILWFIVGEIAVPH